MYIEHGQEEDSIDNFLLFQFVQIFYYMFVLNLLQARKYYWNIIPFIPFLITLTNAVYQLFIMYIDSSFLSRNRNNQRGTIVSSLDDPCSSLKSSLPTDAPAISKKRKSMHKVNRNLPENRYNCNIARSVVSKRNCANARKELKFSWTQRCSICFLLC